VVGSVRGLTLLELLFALLIAAVLIAALFVTATVGRMSYVSADARAHVHQQVRQAFDHMAEELREAGGTVTVTGGSQLKFQVALGYDLGGSCPPSAVCWGARDQLGADRPGWSVQYRGVNGQLIREILDDGGGPQGPPRYLANDVSELAFSYAGGSARVIEIQLQVRRASQQLPGGSVQAGPTALRTRVRLRNT